MAILLNLVKVSNVTERNAAFAAAINVGNPNERTFYVRLYYFLNPTDYSVLWGNTTTRFLHATRSFL